jgi:hypothetical protein
MNLRPLPPEDASPVDLWRNFIASRSRLVPFRGACSHAVHGLRFIPNLRPLSYCAGSAA